MKVLLVIDSLWVGGTERSLAEMLPHLVRAGLSPLVACLASRRQGVEEEVRAAGFEVVLLEGPGLARQVRSLRRLVAAERPALVHSALFRSNLVARLARPRSLGAPLLNSLVNTPYEPARRADPTLRTSKLWLVQAVDALTGRLFVTHFHAVSHAVAAAAERRLAVPSRRITTVERGRDPARLGAPSPERRRAVRRRLGIDATAPTVLTVGRQDFQKGQEHLLRALPALLAAHPGLQLLIAGREGGATELLRDLAATVNDPAGVRFLGHREDVPDLLAAADVFALPSLFEGYPGAVIEAMALATATVASGIPPVRELLEHEETGLLVPPAEADALAASIHRLLADAGLRRRLGEAARARFLERHTAASATRRMVELYKRLAEGGDDASRAP